MSFIMKDSTAPNYSDSISFYIPSNYSFCEDSWLIGKGTYGSVAKAIDNETKQLVAIKKIDILSNDCNIPKEHLIHFFKMVIREITIMKNIKHQNIVSLLDCYLHKYKKDPKDSRIYSSLYLVFEYVEYDLLKAYSEFNFTEQHIESILFQIINTLHYLKALKIIHRDIKPNNILLDVSKCLVKIADFGMSRSMANSLSDITKYKESTCFHAPELVTKAAEYDYQIDIWSVGCVFVWLLTENSLFTAQNLTLNLILDVLGKQLPEDLDDSKFIPDNHQRTTQIKENENRQFKTIKQYLNEKYENGSIVKISEEGWTLLEKLLMFHPKKRITVEEILKDENDYFKNFKKKIEYNYQAAVKCFETFKEITNDFEKLTDLNELNKYFEKEVNTFKTKIIVDPNINENNIGTCSDNNMIIDNN